MQSTNPNIKYRISACLKATTNFIPAEEISRINIEINIYIYLSKLIITYKLHNLNEIRGDIYLINYYYIATNYHYILFQVCDFYNNICYNRILNSFTYLGYILV